MGPMNDTLALLQQHLQPTHRVVHAGDTIHPVGRRFEHLYVIGAGTVKLVNLDADGSERVVGLRLKGDWLGFDGLAAGEHTCDAIALDTSEVWTLHYASLLTACIAHPLLLAALNRAMSQAISTQHQRLGALCSLGADGRVADFLRRWAEALLQCGLRADRIDLRLSRAEIGQQLGLTLESVSRAFSRLARDHLIHFPERGRREVGIPDLAALAGFVERDQAGALH